MRWTLSTPWTLNPQATRPPSPHEEITETGVIPGRAAPLPDLQELLRRALIESDRRHGPDDDEPDDGALAASAPDDGGPNRPLPPLLKRILDEYSADGLPPAYLPKKPRSSE